MIARYTRQEMAAVWEEEARLGAMLEVETAFLEVLSRAKRVPASEVAALKSLAGMPLAARVAEKERASAHDVVALLQVVSEELGVRAPRAVRFLHYGLTSSDVLDTALALQLRRASRLLLGGLSAVEARLAELAARHEGTWMAGRTHGVHAEPITFGMKLAGWHAEVRRDRARLSAAAAQAAFGKLSGAVGAFTHFPPRLEAAVCRSLRLAPEPVSTQVVPRDRHAHFLAAVALAGAGIERFATEIRHLQRTEVLELEEPFGAGQKGSSAMPHKRNPVLCENLCGLARLLRGYAHAALEDIALWHERDISHSSVERVILPDATILLDFMLHRFLQVLEGLTVHPERMRRNLDSSRGLVFSQKVLLALVDKGLSRLEAYDIVQRNAMECWRTGAHLRVLLAKDAAVRGRLGPRELAGCFELGSYKASVREVLRREGILGRARR